ncbi:hypothetical protein VR46_37555, partial [Streptomyces sp. NRRL S-444]
MGQQERLADHRAERRAHCCRLPAPDGDNPRWITEDTATGSLTPNIESASGDLAATTNKTGDTLLQLTTIHGDVALQLPLDISKPPVALYNDEYGNPRAGQPVTRYDWLGGKQRSSET